MYNYESDISGSLVKKKTPSRKYDSLVFILAASGIQHHKRAVVIGMAKAQYVSDTERLRLHDVIVSEHGAVSKVVEDGSSIYASLRFID